ncbi:MAG: hypothetical protein KDA78_17695 [Planctomycetaceae bacterium]|nr:hypothetical protein [Planctomycetaceae bacterium]
MNILKEYVLPVVPVMFIIGLMILSRLTRNHPFVLRMLRRPVVLWRGLAVSAFCACCFAGPFLRQGVDKAFVAFLIIFVPTSLIAIGRWSEYRRYQSTLPPKDPTEEVPS